MKHEEQEKDLLKSGIYMLTNKLNGRIYILDLQRDLEIVGILTDIVLKPINIVTVFYKLITINVALELFYLKLSN